MVIQKKVYCISREPLWGELILLYFPLFSRFLMELSLMEYCFF